MTRPPAAAVMGITLAGTVPLVALWVWVRLVHALDQAVRWGD